MAEALTPAPAVLDLVASLADGQWHSGETLARAEGLTRAALGKRIARARSDLGLDIEGEPGRGYRLAAPLDLIDIDALRQALRDVISEVRHIAVTDSTNTRLLETDGSRDPQLCVADLQTAGRGRRGRSWHSPFAANLYLSVAYGFPAFPPELTGLPLALGAVLAEYLQGLGVEGIGVKWPNDLQVHGRKLGGLLIESRGEAAGRCRVIVGLGLNLAMRDADIDGPWTTLAEALPTLPTRTQLAADAARLIVDTCQQLEHSGFAAFRPRYARYDVLADRAVRVSGEPTLDGIARGIDRHGALLVECDGQRRSVHAGDVSVRSR